MTSSGWPLRIYSAGLRRQLPPCLWTVSIWLVCSIALCVLESVGRSQTISPPIADRAAEIIEQAQPSVCLVTVRIPPEAAHWPNRGDVDEAGSNPLVHGYGLGAAVSAQGHVLTSLNVVESAPFGDLVVTFRGGEPRAASVSIVDPWLRLALLKVDSATDPISIGSSDEANKGNSLVVFGDPSLFAEYGEPVATPTCLLLSPQNGKLDRFSLDPYRHEWQLGPVRSRRQIIHSSTISVGLGGGLLVDGSGKLVGIADGSSTADRPTAAPIDGFAAKALVRWLEGNEIAYGLLGIRAVLQVDSRIADRQSAELPQPFGVTVENVESGSPADRAGIHSGDTITHFLGKPILSAEKLFYDVALSQAGTEVQLTVHDSQSGHTRIASTTLAKLPLPIDVRFRKGVQSWRGFLLEEASAMPRAEATPIVYQGVGILRVNRDRTADGEGLAAGAIIVEVDGAKTTNVQEFIEASRRKTTVRLTDVRGREYSVPAE